ncbi:MAG: shikimate dehydrogenase [Desulfobulbaceae bacterium]|nr:shikimate dehydrogenase [Desulfobulbaceae bacterium]
MKHINTATQLCAIIGNPVGHSLSPSIHNAAFLALGLNFVYLAFKVEDVGSALCGMRALNNFRGMSVTIPHKVEVMKYVDEIPDVDRHIGSINTVINNDGLLTGFGTDGPGAHKAIMDAGIELSGKTVLMLGAGGSARAIAFTLAQKAGLSRLILLNNNKERLNRLATDLKNSTNTPIEPEKLSTESIAAGVKDADLIINTTPVGMHPNEDASLVPPDLFRPEQAVFDIVYNPLDTKLLTQARERGLKIIRGVEMFINQAVLQFERFTGEKAPVDIMRRVVMESLGS